MLGSMTFFPEEAGEQRVVRCGGGVWLEYDAGAGLGAMGSLFFVPRCIGLRGQVWRIPKSLPKSPHVCRRRSTYKGR